MKIILKHGNKLYHMICPNCNCEFLYDWHEMSLTENSNRTYSEKVLCPECEHIMFATREKYNEEDNTDCKL